MKSGKQPIQPKIWLPLAILSALVVAPGCAADKSGAGTETDSSRTVTISGSLVVGEGVSGAPEAAGSSVAGATVFVAGDVESSFVESDENGRFEYDVRISGNLSTSALVDDSVKFFAWKTYGDPAAVSVDRLGRSFTVDPGQATNDRLDAGQIELLWTNAGHFRLNIPDGLAPPASLEEVQVQGVASIPYSYNATTGQVNITYLPPGETYTVTIDPTGYQSITFEQFWPEAENPGPGTWFTIPASEMPLLVVE